jgi:threonylcarbamoyladenosine tRNA methylthiotransferase MtaB
MKHYAVTTLGCKVNQCESAAVGHLMEAHGYRRARDGVRPDVIVINTCTVTGRAAMQSRQAIRQAARRHPTAAIVVTGCYAQTAPDEIAALSDVALIVGHADKLNIGAILDRLRGGAPEPILMHQKISACRDFNALSAVAADGRTRAFLKIQDGCNTMCSYCIVPYARGRSRSMPLTDVLEHLQRLGDGAFREVVLTGIHLGAYGADLDPPATLPHLLSKALQLHRLDRMRLSSIEPTEIDRQLINIIEDSSGGLCRHLHVPLQSGDNAVLKRMGRPYTREDFKEIIRSIGRHLPGAAIGADVLVGFPGEDEAAFGNTFALIEELPITYLHVFPFSPRKGTLAAQFNHKIPERIIKERCRALRLLGEQKKTAFFRSQIGERLTVLVETIDDKGTGLSKGLSDNYIPVSIPDNSIHINTLTPVRIEAVHSNQTVIGRVLTG